MNILYLTNHLDIGGVTSYVLSLAEGMKKRGHTVFLASSGGEMLPFVLEAGVFFIQIPIKTKQEISPAVFLSLLKLRKIIKEKDVDIIHANTRVTQVLAASLGRFCAKPYISTCHGFFKKRLSRRLWPCWGTKVIAISEAVREHLVKDFKVKDADVRLIHNGIDVDKFRVQGSEFRVDKKKKLGLGSGPVVGIVARLSDVKGHAYLIEAMKFVLEKIPQVQLLIVGDGKMKQGLVKLVRSLGIEKSVYFIPAVSDITQVFGAMDLFVMPSLQEGLGLSLMQAMAVGLPVIGSDVGGIKSLIKMGENGILVKAADSLILASAILDLLGDTAQAKLLGDRARDFIRQNFSLDKMIQETETVYSSIL